MLIVHVIGGLGNQMFQYALGRALAHSLGVELRLDVADFSSYELHQGFELDRVFNAKFPVATERDMQALLAWRGMRWCRTVLKKRYFSALRNNKFIVESSFDYWPGVNGVGPDCYLVGYWQSEKYFSQIADMIRADFSFRQDLDQENAELAASLAQSNAISLHVRRGDYAYDKKTHSTHGLCSLDYYHAAIRYMENHVESPVFIVFSDDMPWVKSNLRIDFPCIYVDHNRGRGSYNDMRLMSLCKHNIIANSSFSWWGAWLNAYPGKIVIAPKRWFVAGSATPDLIPEKWVTL